MITFSESYAQAREQITQATLAFAQARAIPCERERLVVDQAEDLSVDTFLLGNPASERLFVCVSGIHGLEGYTGSAVQRALLEGPLARVDFSRCAVWLVHGLNPWGFAHMRRVNRNNVDLNRNVPVVGEQLYGADSAAFEAMAGALVPTRPFGGGWGEALGFAASLLGRLLQLGMGPLRQAILAGQYTRPQGIFYGGAQVQPEIAWYLERLAHRCRQAREVLLVDLHTGYGERGLAYPLFPQADSPDFAAYALQGVKTRSGQDKTYTARGELVRGSAIAARGLGTGLTFNGLILEFGTHGLGVAAQISDLHTVVRENQVQHHGAADEATAARAREAFRELFFPSDPAWQQEVIGRGVENILGLLGQRGFVVQGG